jgi:hypothetical protein
VFNLSLKLQLTLANKASLGATASAGIAGSYGTSKRLFAANGLEPQQVLKGMVPLLWIKLSITI